jgi:hypothetical protein
MASPVVQATVTNETNLTPAVLVPPAEMFLRTENWLTWNWRVAYEADEPSTLPQYTVSYTLDDSEISGSSTPVTGTRSAVVTGFVEAFPEELTVTLVDTSTPHFEWETPTAPPSGGYSYRLTMRAVSGGDEVIFETLTSSATAYTYSGPPLASGDYAWWLDLIDMHENSSTVRGTLTIP